MLCAVLFAAAPLSYGPTIGDYTRRISAARFSDRQIAVALGFGMFVGVLLPSAFGAFTAVSIGSMITPPSPTSTTWSPHRRSGTCCRSW